MAPHDGRMGVLTVLKCHQVKKAISQNLVLDRSPHGDQLLVPTCHTLSYWLLITSIWRCHVDLQIMCIYISFLQLIIKHFVMLCVSFYTLFTPLGYICLSLSHPTHISLSNPIVINFIDPWLSQNGLFMTTPNKFVWSQNFQ